MSALDWLLVVAAGVLVAQGQLDDAVIVALVLRAVLRAAGAELIREHWPGPEPSLNAVLRLAGRAA